MQDPDLKRFYQALSGTDPLTTPEKNKFYVPILQAHPENDPIDRLYQRISWAASESVSLLTGFRGNGKTTELNRLKDRLEADGCWVIRLDMDHYIHPTAPLEIGDFLLSLAAALALAIKEKSGLETLSEKFWERLGNVLQTQVELETLNIKSSGLGMASQIGLKLKNEPSFKQQIQQQLRGCLADITQQIEEFVTQTVKALRKEANNDHLKIIILVDSVEHIRGVGKESQAVYDSIVNTFSGHADKLALPMVHLVYTVPPFLTLHANSATQTLGGNPIVMWPNIHIRTRDGQSDPAGQQIMTEIISKRFASWRDAISEDCLIELANHSGGDLRDYFRLVREILVRLGISQRTGTEEITVDDEMIRNVTSELRNQYRMMLTGQLQERLCAVHKKKQLRPDDNGEIILLTAALDANLIMNYQNGEPWYDIHPLLMGEIKPSDADE
ncbi:MAG: ATP-binding protein [Candidatus Polarisedimenticolaceae bacterium]|nr:ATP-binding protein [Candidatus Polarisedimenticolaceae bacterium]